MQLPFTVEQFFEVIRAYNTAVWPAQVVLLALAVAAIVLVIFPQRWSGAGISLILASLWAWLGLVYHLAFFTSINPLAYAFAAISVAGAAVFFWQGVVRRRLEFRWVASGRAAVGLGLVVFALIVYTAWSSFSGHGYPTLPTFGLPCPTTLFTIGLLAFVGGVDRTREGTRRALLWRRSIKLIFGRWLAARLLFVTELPRSRI